MNFFDLIEKNTIEDVTEYLNKIKKNQKSGMKYKYIEKVDKVLEYLQINNNQLKIVEKKIRDAKTVNFLHDVIAEIIVFYRHLNNNPEFIEESNISTPDIKTRKQLIEVKRIRLSDYQIDILDQIAGGDKPYSANSSVKQIKGNDDPCSLNKKVVEKIDKAIQQIDGSEGIIYIIYSIDPCNHFKDLNERKADFESFCLNYFSLKKINSIEIIVIDLNDLLA